MKNILCFVDISFSYISILLCNVNIKNNKYSIVYYDKQTIDIPDIRYNTAFENDKIFDIFLLMVDNAEKKMKIIIHEVIVVIRSQYICYILTQSELECNNELINIFHEKQLIKNAVSFFKTKYNINNDLTILDILTYEYLLDNNIKTKNSLRMKCNIISAKTGIIYIKNQLIKNFETRLERFKIRIKHFISSDIALSTIVINSKKYSENNLIIDFNEINTSYCLVNENIVLYKNIVEIGNFDIIRDIAKIFNISNVEAEQLKLNLNDLSKMPPNHVITLKFDENNVKYVSVFEIIKVANARIIEILKIIKFDINKMNDKVLLNKIIIYGNITDYFDILNLISNVFKINITDIDFIKNLLSYKNDFVMNNVNIYNSLDLIGAIDYYLIHLNAYNNAKYSVVLKNTYTKFRKFLEDIIY